MKRNSDKWLAGYSALVFLLASVSLPAMAAPQRTSQSILAGSSANRTVSPIGSAGTSAVTVSKLTSVAPRLPVSVTRGSGLVFAGDPTLPGQFNLNLSSVTAAYAANISKSTQIYVGGVLSGGGRVRGGTAETITPGQLLTPAQYVALGQVSATGHQSLVLTANGAASSGFLTLLPGEVSGLSGLYVPSGVSLNSIGFTQATPFVVTGASTVNGSFYALQQSRGLTSQLNLASLAVGLGGLITSNLPSNSRLFPNVFAGSGLAVNVAGALHNFGTISSAGTLSLAAGGGIYNQGSSAQIIGQVVNLYSNSGTFANAGLISASSGNVNFASQLNSDINFNNAGGTVSALAGAVNFRDASYNGANNLTINGGNLLAQTLNLYSGQGNVDVTADTVQGLVNVYGGSAHVVTSTNNLQLGTMDVSGDPLFYNQQVSGIGGDVTIQSDLIFTGQKLAIVAGGNISVNASGPIIIDTSGTISAPQDGGNIYLVAGADIGPCTSGCSTSDPMPPNGQAPNGTSISVNGASQTGGSINLTNVSSIHTSGYSSISNNSNGGTVMMVAFAGAASNSGTINAGGTTITTSGSGGGNNGSVIVIAGATSGTAVTLGTVNATGGTGSASGTGNVSIYTAQPTLSGSSAAIFDYTGALSNTGSTFVPASQLQSATVVLNGSLSASNTLNLQVGTGTINLGGNVRAAIVTINANNGGISIGSSQVTGTTSVTMMTMNGDLIAGSSGLISGGDVNLFACEGQIGDPTGSGQRVNTAATNTLTLNGDDGVYVSQSGSVSLQASGNEDTGNFNLVVTSGDLTLAGNVNYDPLNGPDLSTTTRLQATLGNIFWQSGGVGGGSIFLTANAGNIGTVGAPVQAYTTFTNSLVVSVPTTKSAFVVCNGCAAPPQPTPKTPEANRETVTSDLGDSGTTPGSTPAELTATKIATDTTPQSAEAAALNGTGGNQPNVPAETNAELNGPIGGTSVATGHFDSNEIANLRSSGVDIGEGSNNNFVILNRGNLLFQPNHDIAVRVQEGTVFIPNGASAFVIETGHDVAVYDMHDGHHGAVKVQVGKKLITLTPGKQLVLTRQLAADFDQINPGKRIACRGVRGEVVADGIKAYAADFSIPSIMMNVAPIKRLLASDIPSERRQAHQLLKNAVILAQMNGQAAPYQSPTAGAPTQP